MLILSREYILVMNVTSSHGHSRFGASSSKLLARVVLARRQDEQVRLNDAKLIAFRLSAQPDLWAHARD